MGMNRVSHPTDPLSTAPNSPFLAEVLASLAKRRKAIRHKARSITVEKVRERANAEEREKLEISAEVGAARLRLFVWDDRWVFIDARAPTKRSGWAWEFSYEGRMVGDEARALIGAFEQSIEATTTQPAETLAGVWKPLLASGPRLSS
jgi:hypothetical protein